MKTTRNLVAILLVAFASLFAINAGGQVSSFPFPIGTPQIVESNAVSNVSAIFFWAWYCNTNGIYKTYSVPSPWYVLSPLASKYEMDQTVIASKLSNILNSIAISTNINIDKSKAVEIFVACRMEANVNLATASFSTPYVYISLLFTNGVYSIPDLSWFKTQICPTVPFYIPKLKWARLEIGHTGSPDSFDVRDERIDPLMDILHSDGFMYLPTAIISNSSKTNGLYWLKLSTLSDSFQSFDGDGTLLPEIPFGTKTGMSGSSIIVNVSGGDSGRGYFLQQSSNLKNWTKCGDVQFVSQFLHLFPQGDIRTFVFPTTNSLMFFRTATTNTVPY